MKTGYSTTQEPLLPTRELLSLIRDRRSCRTAFDPTRPVSEEELADVLEAARWAPTAHNMQNFEIVVVDEAPVLATLGAIEAPISETFVRENYRQLAFSRGELRLKQTGLLADSFPSQWRQPVITAEVLPALGPSYLRYTMRGAPMIVVVTHDPRTRAPASEGDVLGMISLGCVLENMWLAAHALGLDVHVMSAFAGEPVASAVKRALGIPSSLDIAYALALGHAAATDEYLRVRRDVVRFAHRNRYHR